MVFLTKIRKILWEGGAHPLPKPFPSGEGASPSQNCGISTPPILKSWVRHREPTNAALTNERRTALTIT